MLKPRRVLIALLAVACCSFGLATAHASYGEKIEFVSGAKKEPVFGYLSLPPNTTKPVPAIVLVHGSGGLGEREGRYVAEFNKMGIATFALDSFAPRGADSTVASQDKVSGPQMVSDAFGALKLLSEHPQINKNRIGILGASKGGTVAIETGLAAPRRTRQIPPDLKFAAHIPMYPGCTTQYRPPLTSGAPMLVLLAGRDNYTGTEKCLEYVDTIKKTGGKLDVITYPNAEHGFDGKDGQKSVWVANAQNFSKCVVYVEEGKLIYAKTGANLGTPLEAFKFLAKDCMTRGASVGTDFAAKSKSLQDVQEFLKKNLLKE
jgi:dienelactone hydrolase